MSANTWISRLSVIGVALVCAGAAFFLLRDTVLVIPTILALLAAAVVLIGATGRLPKLPLLAMALFPLLLLILMGVLGGEDPVALAIVTGIAVLGFGALTFLPNALVGLAMAVVAAAGGVGGMEIGPRVMAKLTPDPVLGTALVEGETTIRDTHFGKLRLRTVTVPVVKKTGIYNFLAQYNGTMIWSDAHANFYAIGEDESFRELNINLESNGDAFRAATPPSIQHNRFSVKDIAVYRDMLYVSHLIYDDAGSCYQLRISQVPISDDALETNTWSDPEPLYTSNPCIEINDETVEGQLMEAGGRLAFVDGAAIVTHGDHMHDGRAKETGDLRPMFAQDPSVDYGKTLRIDLETGAFDIYTTGHRNPQGLHVSANGEVWLTEHGPKGGDELNRLVPGQNYGWPLVTYGTEYNQYNWIHNFGPNGEHPGFEGPEYAWVPSIGISASLEVGSGGFEAWQGDVLVTSLRARSMFRVRSRNGGVVSIEQIELGLPIRDIVELPDGRFALSTTNSTILFVEPLAEGQEFEGVPAIEERLEMASLDRGHAVYEAQCAACHGDGTVAGAGPALHGIFGAIDRTTSDYEYSTAFLDRDIEWSDATLDIWLAEPLQFVPGTTMAVGLADPQERADVILYLKSLQDQS